jgi:hypothetical protein
MSRPIDIPTLGHRGYAHAMIKIDVTVGGLREVERNLCGLTMGVPSMRIQDAPLHIQIHIVG